MDDNVLCYTAHVAQEFFKKQDLHVLHHLISKKTWLSTDLWSTAVLPHSIQKLK